MRYKTVVITGASSGLGEEFARQMALDAESLILVARREEKLTALKEELEQTFPSLEVVTEVVDLNDTDQLDAFCKKLTGDVYQPHVLVNNAGMGDLGSFAKSDWPKVNAMLHLNIQVLTRLAHAVIPSMKEQGGGYILNVSSLASVMPIPDFAVYAATKAYVTSFSEALRLELMEENIFVTALCPGPVHTEFSTVAERRSGRKESDLKEWAYVSKERCVREGLNAMDLNKAILFPGIQVKAFAALFRSTPKVILRRLMQRRPRKSD